MNLNPPTDSKTLALYLLLNAGIKGYTSYDAVISDRFFKFSTRVSDLVNDHNLNVHKRFEKGKNRFGHEYQSIRYTLFECDLTDNIDLYNRLNNPNDHKPQPVKIGVQKDLFGDFN